MAEVCLYHLRKYNTVFISVQQVLMVLTSNVKSLGYRYGAFDLMNFSETLAKLAASSIFPESTRHLIRCLNRSRQQMRLAVFLCDMTVTGKYPKTYGHQSWCEFYHSSLSTTVHVKLLIYFILTNLWCGVQCTIALHTTTDCLS